MARRTERDVGAYGAVDTVFAILMSLAALLALMGILGLASRLLAVTPDPVWIGVVSLLVVAVIVAALYAGPNRPDAPEIPGRKAFLFLALGIAAGFLWWLLGRAVPALAPFDLSPLLIGLLVYFLLLGYERRREPDPQTGAPDEASVMTAPRGTRKVRTSRRASKRRAAKRKVSKQRTAKRR